MALMGDPSLKLNYYGSPIIVESKNEMIKILYDIKENKGFESMIYYYLDNNNNIEKDENVIIDGINYSAPCAVNYNSLIYYDGYNWQIIDNVKLTDNLNQNAREGVPADAKAVKDLFDKTLNYCGILSSDNDNSELHVIDSINTTSIYMLSAGNTYYGLPDNEEPRTNAYLLLTIISDSARTKKQILIGKNNNIFIRHYQNNWDAWTNLTETDKTLSILDRAADAKAVGEKALLYKGVFEINDLNDLNDLHEHSIYALSTSKSYENCPDDQLNNNKPYETYYVITITTPAQATVKQIFFGKNNTIYMRIGKKQQTENSSSGNLEYEWVWTSWKNLTKTHNALEWVTNNYDNNFTLDSIKDNSIQTISGKDFLRIFGLPEEQNVYNKFSTQTLINQLTEEEKEIMEIPKSYSESTLNQEQVNRWQKYILQNYDYCYCFSLKDSNNNYQVLNNFAKDIGLSTTYYLEQQTRPKRDNIYKEAKQYLLYRLPRTTVWSGYHSAITNANHESEAENVVKEQSSKTIIWNKIISENSVPPDSLEPLYIAIGASTVWGAVHGYQDLNETQINNIFGNSYIAGPYENDEANEEMLKIYKNKSVIRSSVNVPNYVSEMLHLSLLDLSVGSTGFLARNGTNNNFMDQLYKNKESLKKAELVSIIFGYGNDGGAGLPIGQWNDYYPYYDNDNDDDSYRPYSGDSTGYTTDQRSSDYTQMLVEKKATLFGCLNWCIKFISENSQAQIIIVFAAPSQNRLRQINIGDKDDDSDPNTPPTKFLYINTRQFQDNTEIFEDDNPYRETASTSNYCQQLWQIGDQLKILKEKLSIPIIDTYNDTGNAFNYWQTSASESLDESEYFNVAVKKQQIEGTNQFELKLITQDSANAEELNELEEFNKSLKKYKFFSTVWQSSDHKLSFYSNGTLKGYPYLIFNSHPTEIGYKIYSKFIAGLIAQYYLH